MSSFLYQLASFAFWRRRLVLGVVCLGQLIVALDATVVNIAAAAEFAAQPAPG